jgi:hypothetical protein
VPPPQSHTSWSLKYYLVTSTDNQAPRYVVFSAPLLPRPS